MRVEFVVFSRMPTIVVERIPFLFENSKV